MKKRLESNHNSQGQTKNHQVGVKKAAVER